MQKLTEIFAYTKTDKTATNIPIIMAPHGCTIRFADVPIATPPARVEFCMCTILNLYLEKINENINETTQHDDNDKYVFTIARNCSRPFKSNALKLGQNSHRNIVPD